LRLPTGIFYAQGVKTNVLFFTRAGEEAPTEDATKAVWVYDMRTGAPAYGKTNALKSGDFDGFKSAFGDDPLGHAPRVDQGETGRFRCFSRRDVAANNDNLDITWLREEVSHDDDLTEPDEIADAIIGHLRAALNEIEEFGEVLVEGVPPAVETAA
jgi:type I restriction enzyme M protein